MSTDQSLVLFHAPRTRSSGALVLLEELGAPYTLQWVNLKAGEQRQAAYLAINPMGKVPAVRHGDAVITEQVAIFIYLADAFPDAGLAPLVGDPLRGPYLRWMVFYAACLEPAVIDRTLKRDPGPAAMAPYGDYDTLFSALIAQLAKGSYLLGERFSAADLLWGTALNWMTMWKLVPDAPEIAAYIARIQSRPSIAKVSALDAAAVADQEQAAKS